jgi:hypothetical protein
VAIRAIVIALYTAALFFILAETAENFFCPSLQQIAKVSDTRIGLSY